uniref:Phospholipase A2 n=1 Tax=Knipowitschia caucasica TaxID=637954 RepID=A0AAV2JP53_KNICA
MDALRTMWSWSSDMAFSLLPRDQDPPGHVEFVSYLTLNVTVLRAKTHTSQDYWSQSDLYVSLTLPTATSTSRRTRTINHNNQPEWNEGFNFRFPTQTKNILEIRVLDEDLLSRDDLVSMVLRTFSLSPETEDVVELEFELSQSSEEATREYMSNGILMAAPLSVLSVEVKKMQPAHYLSSCPMLNLSGAYEGTQVLNALTERLHFHMNPELEAELGLAETKEVEAAADTDKQEVLHSSVPLKPVPHRRSGSISLTLDQNSVDLRLESFERSKQDLEVRLSLDLCSQEKDFLLKRRATVARQLQSVLGLKTKPSLNQVPTVAVVASGGGARACVGTLGSLKGLKEIGVLDLVSYITGVSGSTWALSSLCQDEDWSHRLETLISKTRVQMTKSTMGAFSLDQMSYYWDRMEQKEKQGHLVSYIDMAGLILEHLVFGETNSSQLLLLSPPQTNSSSPLLRLTPPPPQTNSSQLLLLSPPQTNSSSPQTNSSQLLLLSPPQTNSSSPQTNSSALLRHSLSTNSPLLRPRSSSLLLRLTPPLLRLTPLSCSSSLLLRLTPPLLRLTPLSCSSSLLLRLTPPLLRLTPPPPPQTNSSQLLLLSPPQTYSSSLLRLTPPPPPQTNSSSPQTNSSSSSSD